MAATGSRRISLKHFAMDGRERNIYNRLQAYNGSCVPFGCGGGGGFGGFFFYQGGSLERYYASMDAGRKPLTQVTPVTPDSTVLNRLAGDIRIGGVFNPARIQQETGHRGIPLPELFQPLLAQYESRGLLKSAPGGEIVLTPAGQFWHNAIIQNLTALFAYSRKQEKEIS